MVVVTGGEDVLPVLLWEAEHLGDHLTTVLAAGEVGTVRLSEKNMNIILPNSAPVGKISLSSAEINIITIQASLLIEVEAETELGNITLEQKPKQAQLGVPHSRIQVELGFILQA